MSRLEPREALRSLLHSLYQCRGAEEREERGICRVGGTGKKGGRGGGWRDAHSSFNRIDTLPVARRGDQYCPCGRCRDDWYLFPWLPAPCGKPWAG